MTVAVEARSVFRWKDRHVNSEKLFLGAYQPITKLQLARRVPEPLKTARVAVGRLVDAANLEPGISVVRRGRAVPKEGRRLRSDCVASSAVDPRLVGPTIAVPGETRRVSAEGTTCRPVQQLLVCHRKPRDEAPAGVQPVTALAAGPSLRSSNNRDSTIAY